MTELFIAAIFVHGVVALFIGIQAVSRPTKVNDVLDRIRIRLVGEHGGVVFSDMLVRAVGGFCLLLGSVFLVGTVGGVASLLIANS